MKESVCISLSLLLLVLNVHCNTSTVRQTNYGPVEGLLRRSSLGQKYYAFRGIPFAEAPISGKDPNTGKEVDRRFKVWYYKQTQNQLFNFDKQFFF